MDYLGSEVLGLNMTLQNLLSFLNLAEMGIGAAVAYNLYKPIYDGDRQSINDIVSIQGWLYRRIAFFVIGGSCILMCFFPLFFAKAELPLWYAYGSLIALMFSALLGYFVNYRQIVLSADQKEYRITLSVQGTKALKILFQMLAVWQFAYGYVWWMVIEAVMAVMTSIILDKEIKKEYPWLHPIVSKGKKLQQQYPNIVTKTKQLFFHKISYFILSQTSPIIIYAYASLTLVAIYGNYMLIVFGVVTLMSALLNSINAGVGNLVAEGNHRRIKTVFWEITSLRMWIASVICFVLYMLGHSFVGLWVGTEYILSQSAFMVLLVYTFIALTRTNDTFLAAYGLFEDTWAPITEVVLNLGLSVLLGYFWGLVGILLGVLVSLLIIVCIWKPYFLYKRGFQENPLEYLWRYGKYLIIMAIPFSIAVGISKKIWSCIEIDSFLQLGFHALVLVFLYMLLSLPLLFFADHTCREMMKRVIGLLCRTR